MFETNFVETHEYDPETSLCTLMEYFAYEHKYFQGLEDMYAPTHHTILLLACF
jgi:hypothetical protein